MTTLSSDDCFTWPNKEETANMMLLTNRAMSLLAGYIEYELSQTEMVGRLYVERDSPYRSGLLEKIELNKQAKDEMAAKILEDIEISDAIKEIKENGHSSIAPVPLTAVGGFKGLYEKITNSYLTTLEFKVLMHWIQRAMIVNHYKSPGGKHHTQGRSYKR